MYCSVLQHIAVCCSVSHSVAVCCSMLKYVAVCVAVCRQIMLDAVYLYFIWRYSVLQCVAVCYDAAGGL